MNTIPDNYNDILCVSAYKDIGREKWGAYQRSNEEYFKNFMNLCNNINYKLIVYLDDKIKDELMSRFTFSSNIIFKNLNNVDTFFNKFLERDKIVMNIKELW